MKRISAADGRLGRDAERLLLALTREGAGPARSDLRDGFLVVAAPRNGVTAIVANAPAAAGEELARRGLAEWRGTAGARTLAPSAAGAAYARRQAAPDGVDPFLAQHADIARRAPEQGGTAVLVDESESPLAWLARRRRRDGSPFLEPAQVQAGERFRRDVAAAQIAPRVTSDWSGLPPSGARGAQQLHISELAIAARQRLDRAADAVGRELNGLLVDVCGFQKGLELVERERAWPPRAAKVVLGIALDRLATHYGIASCARGPDRARGVRKWATEDARPRIDGESAGL